MYKMLALFTFGLITFTVLIAVMLISTGNNIHVGLVFFAFILAPIYRYAANNCFCQKCRQYGVSSNPITLFKSKGCVNCGSVF